MFKRLFNLLLIVCLLLMSDMYVTPLTTEHVHADGEPVVVLIVDDFNPSETVADILEYIDSARQDELCFASPAVSVDQGNAVSSRFMGDVVGEPHGSVVENIVNGLKSNALIGVRRVDIRGYTETQIAEAIEAVINSLRENEDDEDDVRIVINMSFALIPCAFYRAMHETNMTLVELQPFADAYRDSMAIQGNHIPNGLWALFSRHDNAIPVAAAGNYGYFGFTMPFAPAIWENVISVSANLSSEDFNNLSEDRLYIPSNNLGEMDIASNPGEIMMPGLWSVNGHQVAGTSFATPRLSVLVARFLLQHAPRCSNGAVPLTYQDWLDRNVPDNYCQFSSSQPVSLSVTSTISGGALSCGNQVTGTISNTNWQTQWPLNANSGQQVTIEMRDPSSTLDTYLILRNPSGQEVTRDDDGGGGLNSRLIYDIPASGTYTVVATRFGEGTGISTGNYTLTVSCTSVRPANSVSCNSRVTGSISDRDWEDRWSFGTRTAQRLTISMNSTSDNLDPFLQLLDGSGNEVAIDDDGGEEYNSQLQYNVTAGTYTIVATRFGQQQGGSSGSYVLSVSCR